MPPPPSSGITFPAGMNDTSFRGEEASTPISRCCSTQPKRSPCSIGQTGTQGALCPSLRDKPVAGRHATDFGTGDMRTPHRGAAACSVEGFIDFQRTSPRGVRSGLPRTVSPDFPSTGPRHLRASTRLMHGTREALDSTLDCRGRPEAGRLPLGCRRPPGGGRLPLGCRGHPGGATSV